MRELRTVNTDVAVMGAGPAGLLLAMSLARRGLRCSLVDEQRTPGGGLLYFPDRATPRLWQEEPRASEGAAALFGGAPGENVDALRDRLVEAVVGSGVTLVQGAAVLGVLEGDDWLVDSNEGLLRLRARAYAIAGGAHDAAPMFEGNDLPGIVSARAACRLLREGVLIGDAPVVIGDGPYADAFAARATTEGARVNRARGSVLRARGLSGVRSADIGTNASSGLATGTTQRVACDAIVIDGRGAPSFEVAVQAGASVRWCKDGYAVATNDEGGCVSSGCPLIAVGEVVGAPLDLALFANSAERAAAHVVRKLS